MKRVFVNIVLGAVFAASASSAFAGSLTVEAVGAPHDEGKILAALFHEDTFLEEPIAKRSVDLDGLGGGRLVFEDLAPGRYAVVLVHDENADGKMDRGMLRLPKEHYVFSGNVIPRLRRPSFDAVGFDVKGAVRISIDFGRRAPEEPQVLVRDMSSGGQSGEASTAQ